MTMTKEELNIRKLKYLLPYSLPKINLLSTLKYHSSYSVE